MNLVLTCSTIIFLKTFILFNLNTVPVVDGKFTVSTRMALAVCEQRDEYFTSKKLSPPLKKKPASQSSSDLACGRFKLKKCPTCPIKFKTCAEVAKGKKKKGKGAMKAGKFRKAGKSADTENGPKIDPSLRAELQQKSTATIIVSMQGGNTKALEQHATRDFDSREEQIEAVVQSLEELASTSQKSVMEILAKPNYASLSTSVLWITNQIVIRNADLSLAEELEKVTEVSKISPNYVIQHDARPLKGGGEGPRPDTKGTEPETEDEGDEDRAGEQDKWNILEMGVPKIWEQGIKGKGVVVGILDTGVRGTHNGLKGNFRTDGYGWFDPMDKSKTPQDPIGFGTWGAGVIVSPLNSMGIAPEATWMACRCFKADGAVVEAVLSCFQWFMCPTDPDGNKKDCSKAPKVINNGWSTGSGSSSWIQAVSAWRAAGIIPTFSIGTVDNQDCSSARSPGDYDNVIGSGIVTKAVNGDGSITRHPSSGVGPTVSGSRLKPDVCGYAGAIYTTGKDSDDQVQLGFDGTSAGTAHVTGLVALLLSEKPDLTYDQILASVTKGATKLNKTTGKTCGGITEDTYPNHFVGYGKLNAVNTFKYMRDNFIPIPPTTPPPPTTTTTWAPGPTLDPPKFTCYEADSCKDAGKLVESPFPECVIVNLKDKEKKFHPQKVEQGKCDDGAEKCDFCFISKCNDPKKYCK